MVPKTPVLDNLAEIKRIDKDNMLSFCIEAPRHYEKAVKMAREVSTDYLKPKTIIVAGMGGSAISGELLKDLMRDKITTPIEVCREYTLPAYANEESLVFIVSYSGETEETLNCFLDAVKRKCMIFCISSGGSILKAAEKLKMPALKIPKDIPPRAALPYLFAPLLIFLEKLGLASDTSKEIFETITVLKQICDENAPEKPLKENFSKEIAIKIDGTVPVIYGFGLYRSVAQRFKQQLNENSKIPAFWNSFPELNHNEIVGWEKPEKLAKFFSALIIREKAETKEIKCRIEATKEILNTKVAGIHEVWSRGTGKLAKMLSATLIGDFISVYLAILRGVDPTPVETISLLKRKLEKRGTKDKTLRELQILTKREAEDAI